MICVAWPKFWPRIVSGFLENPGINLRRKKMSQKQSRGLNLDEPPCPTKGIQLVSWWLNEAAGMIRFLGGWFRESHPSKKDAWKVFQVKY